MFILDTIVMDHDVKKILDKVIHDKFYDSSYSILREKIIDDRRLFNDLVDSIIVDFYIEVIKNLSPGKSTNVNREIEIDMYIRGKLFDEFNAQRLSKSIDNNKNNEGKNNATGNIKETDRAKVNTESFLHYLGLSEYEIDYFNKKCERCTKYSDTNEKINCLLKRIRKINSSNNNGKIYFDEFLYELLKSLRDKR